MVYGYFLFKRASYRIGLLRTCEGLITQHPIRVVILNLLTRVSFSTFPRAFHEWFRKSWPQDLYCVRQFAAVTSVIYLSVYQRFLDGVNALKFDLSWILSLSCVLKLDFHDRLLLATLRPIVATALLGMTYGVPVLRSRKSGEGITNVRLKHVSIVLLRAFLVY